MDNSDFLNHWTARHREDRRRFFNSAAAKRAREIIFDENPAQAIDKARFGREESKEIQALRGQGAADHSEYGRTVANGARRAMLLVMER